MSIPERAIATGAALALANSPAGAAAGLIPAVGGIYEFVKNRRIERTERFWTSVIQDPGWETPQEVQGKIEEQISQDPNAQEVIWESVKAMLEAVTLDACEIGGSITAEYLREKKGPDAFFRGAIRLLIDLSTEEFELFRVLLKEVGSCVDKKAVLIAKEDLSLRLSTPSSPEVPLHPSISLKHDPKRLFRLLKANDLGVDPDPNSWNSISGPLTIFPDTDAFKRLANHFGIKT